MFIKAHQKHSYMKLHGQAEFKQDVKRCPMDKWEVLCQGRHDENDGDRGVSVVRESKFKSEDLIAVRSLGVAE